MVKWFLLLVECGNETLTVEHQWVSANGSVMSVIFGCLFLPDTVGSRGTKKPPPAAADTNIQYMIHLYQAKVAFVVFLATKLYSIAFGENQGQK